MTERPSTRPRYGRAKIAEQMVAHRIDDAKRLEDKAFRIEQSVRRDRASGSRWDIEGYIHQEEYHAVRIEKAHIMREQAKVRRAEAALWEREESNRVAYEAEMRRRGRVPEDQS